MKIDATDPKCPDWKKFLFPCDANDNDFLSIQWWTENGVLDPNDPHPFLEIIPSIWAGGWWDRIKAAGKILSGRPHYNGGIILTEDTVERLRETLDEIEILRERGENHGKVERTNEDEHVHKDEDT